MEKINRVKIDINKIKQAGPDIFALNNVLKSSSVVYEYRIDGDWSSLPPTKRPEGKRAVFSTVDSFRVAKDTYFSWTDLIQLRTKARQQDMLLEKPEYPEKIMQRLYEARTTRKPLTLFVPWGVRLAGAFRNTEAEVMNRLSIIQEIIESRNIPTNVLIMPADVYATEVNNQVQRQDAINYFVRVTKEAQNRGFTVKPWSQIREENQTVYNLRFAQLDEQGLQEILSPKKMTEAIEAAKRRSGYTDKERIKNASLAYLRERIIEAEIIEKQYKPIKMSVVGKNKDNEVDCELPRMYLIPPHLQFPWLK